MSDAEDDKWLGGLPAYARPLATPSEVAQEAASDWFKKVNDRPRRPYHKNLALHFDEFAAKHCERLTAQKDELIAALREIASFGDAGAGEHLRETGSYSLFDEPHAVRIARTALTKADAP